MSNTTRLHKDGSTCYYPDSCPELSGVQPEAKQLISEATDRLTLALSLVRLYGTEYIAIVQALHELRQLPQE